MLENTCILGEGTKTGPLVNEPPVKVIFDWESPSLTKQQQVNYL